MLQYPFHSLSKFQDQGYEFKKNHNVKSIWHKQIPQYVPFSSFVLSYTHEMSKI